MKQLFLLFLLLPLTLFAQEDPKYLAGAVPEVDGRVVFTKELNLPGRSQNDIFKAFQTWAEGYFIPTKEFQSQILYQSPEKGELVAQGQEYLVFTNKALSLDRSLTTYQMFIECAPGKCNLKITSIRYKYNASSNGSEIIRAEDQITDKYTLTKKNKLIRATGKFRTHTIDLVNRVFDAATAAVGATPAIVPAGQNVAATPATISPETTVTTIPSAGTSSLSGYKQISPDKIPGNIYKMLSENWMLVTAGTDAKFNMMTASWGGLGHMYNKPVAFCFINPTRYTYQLMENNDTYTLSFYTETYREALQYCGTHSGKDQDKVKESGLTPITTPSGSKSFSEAWMIIECRKLIAQPINPASILDEAARAKWGKEPHQMYIGEILNVWVK